MNFNADLFISYNSEQDGLQEVQKDWYPHFKKHLGHLIERLIGKKPVIISSEEDIKAGEYSKIPCFIVILNSPGVNSDKSLKEINQIIKTGKPIYKVLIEPIAEIRNVEGLANYMDYNFFTTGQNPDDTGLNKLLNFKSDSLYWFKLIDLAYDIYKHFIPRPEQDESSVKQTKGNVYLAETTIDQDNNRNLIRKELQLHGYKVFPDKPLSKDFNSVSGEINNYLNDSVISIHIIGENYGETLLNSNKSKVEIQNELAAKYYKEAIVNRKNTKGKFFFRLIYIPLNLNIKDQEQFKFVENLKRDIRLIEGAEIIQTPLEELKSIIRDKIELQTDTTHYKPQAENNKIKIYCIHEKDQTKQLKSVKEISGKFGFEIITTYFSEDEVKNLETHKQNLLISDAILIIYEKENVPWINTKLKDLLKIPGYGKKIPFRGKAILTNPALSDINEEYLKNMDIINFNGTIEEKTLKPFLEKISK